jgi:predicted esterase
MNAASKAGLFWITLACGCATICGTVSGDDSTAAARTGSLLPTHVLALPRTGLSGRIPVTYDAVRLQLASGDWRRPKVGDTIPYGNDADQQQWFELTADAKGMIRDPRIAGGYVLWTLESEADCVMRLVAQPYATAYINGRARYGDLYGYGFVNVPIMLRQGSNDLLFHCRFGQFQATLEPIDHDFQLNVADATLPDILRDRPGHYDASIVVVNNTPENVRDVVLRSALGDGKAVTSPLPLLHACSTYKAPFRFDFSGENASQEKLPLKLELIRSSDGSVWHEETIELNVRSERDPHKVTFVSEIDGSVQYYAVAPALGSEDAISKPAMVFTTHGASVEATGQVAAYGRKTWAHIVGSTNRRPFGFDWEDWGRLDALEALNSAQRRLDHDPQRVYLTGHSMGGHGAWHLGVTYPDRFAAIGPSAGWMSFWSYGAKEVKPVDAIDALMWRATLPSRTRQLSTNLLNHGIYILHGDADDNVPVEQARQMRAHLSEFHHDLHYHEQPNAGHWWDGDDEPGAACVDWAPMFDLFARRRIPAADELRGLTFMTANPAVSSRYHWVTIESQVKALAPSSIKLRYTPLDHRIVGTTNNVHRLAFDFARLRATSELKVKLDGNELVVNVPSDQVTDGSEEANKRVRLERDAGRWQIVDAPTTAVKGPHRSGPFKEAFRNRFMLVYGTGGNAAENEWARNKALYDAESFLYRGNGAATVLPDQDFESETHQECNVILYGNADTNRAWKRVVASDTFDVSRGALRLGKRQLQSEHLACLIVYPRTGTDRSLVGIVGGTGIEGMRTTDRLPYFVSGVAYPDVTIIDGSKTQQGPQAIVAAGFFGHDWQVSTGEFEFRLANRADASSQDEPAQVENVQ